MLKVGLKWSFNILINSAYNLSPSLSEVNNFLSNLKVCRLTTDKSVTCFILLHSFYLQWGKTIIAQHTVSILQKQHKYSLIMLKVTILVAKCHVYIDINLSGLLSWCAINLRHCICITVLYITIWYCILIH